MEGRAAAWPALACSAALALALAAAALAALASRRRRAAGAQRRGGGRSADPGALLREVAARSKAVMYVVSNKTNDQFSAKGLASYLRKKGVEADEGHGDPEGAVITNAHKLLELLDAAVGAGPLWKHEFVRELVGRAWLEDLFPAMKEAYEPQPLDYGRNSRYGDKWRISCYLVVMENWKPKIMPHDPMVRCMGPVMDACVEKFREWHCRRRALASAEVSVMNAFVTRYRPIQEEDQLKRHIDGANVDGSVILALPTDDPFVGGALHVWDDRAGQHELVYQMRPGDVVFLDNAVWHQAKPISSGTRWALVLFLRVR